MAKAEKKVLGLLPRGITTTLLLGLVAVIILALIWSYVMALELSQNNAWLYLAELILLAVLVGLAVGLLANNAKASTLWVAAGLTALAVVLIHGLQEYGIGYGEAVDASLLGALQGEAFGLSVSAGAVVLGIIAAACAAIGAGTKDRLAK